MALFTLTRLTSNDISTMGQITTVLGTVMCKTVEDAFHPTKIAGKTRIPTSPADHPYKLALRPKGASRLDARLADLIGADAYHGTIEICAVPNFADVLIHPGNTDLDTLGCVLVGDAITMGPQGYEIAGGTSRPAFVRIYPILVEAIRSLEGASLAVIDKDR